MMVKTCGAEKGFFKKLIHRPFDEFKCLKLKVIPCIIHQQ